MSFDADEKLFDPNDADLEALSAMGSPCSSESLIHDLDDVPRFKDIQFETELDISRMQDHFRALDMASMGYEQPPASSLDPTQPYWEKLSAFDSSSSLDKPSLLSSNTATFNSKLSWSETVVDLVEESAAVERAPLTAPPPLGSYFEPNSTFRLVGDTAQTLFMQLVTVLTSLGAAVAKHKDDSGDDWAVQGVSPADDKKAFYHVYFYSPTNGSTDQLVVEMQKRSGDSLAFSEFYKSVCQACPNAESLDESHPLPQPPHTTPVLDSAFEDEQAAEPLPYSKFLDAECHENRLEGATCVLRAALAHRKVDEGCTDGLLNIICEQTSSVPLQSPADEFSLIVMPNGLELPVTAAKALDLLIQQRSDCEAARAQLSAEQLSSALCILAHMLACGVEKFWLPAARLISWFAPMLNKQLKQLDRNSVAMAFTAASRIPADKLPHDLVNLQESLVQ